MRRYSSYIQLYNRQPVPDGRAPPNGRLDGPKWANPIDDFEKNVLQKKLIAPY